MDGHIDLYEVRAILERWTQELNTLDVLGGDHEIIERMKRSSEEIIAWLSQRENLLDMALVNHKIKGFLSVVSSSIYLLKMNHSTEIKMIEFLSNSLQMSVFVEKAIQVNPDYLP